MSSGEEYEIGIVCGQCESFNSLGAEQCPSCSSELALRKNISSIVPPPARSESAPPPAVERPPAQPASSGPTAAKRPEVSVSEEEPMEPARHYVCRSCSSAVPAGHKFCGRCGTPVPPEMRDLKTDYFGDMQNPTKAKLILIRGEGMDGLSFHLKAEQHIVGREGQLIFPDDPFVSPRHANFFYRQGKLVVRDEGSVNGVYIRVRGSVPIAPGDTFVAGEQLFRLERVPEIDDDGPDEDGTSFYTSPKREGAFRLAQLFRGGAVGMAVNAHGATMVVGRDGADLNFPQDVYMSGEHCKIAEEGGKFTLTDLESRNGTYVRVMKEKELAHGDYLFIGRKLLRVELNTN